MTRAGSGGDATPAGVTLRACALCFAHGMATGHQWRALPAGSQALWVMPVCCAHQKYLENIWSLFNLGRHLVGVDISEGTYMSLGYLKKRKGRGLVHIWGPMVLNFEEIPVII